MSARVASGLLVVAVALACQSRSPFSRPPAAVAVDEPCRFLGTVHKESRQRLEEMRSCGALSYDEWACMARALKALDDEFTARCRQASPGYRAIESRQRELHAACRREADPAVVDCAVLTTDPACRVPLCEAHSSRRRKSVASSAGAKAAQSPSRVATWVGEASSS